MKERKFRFKEEDIRGFKKMLKMQGETNERVLVAWCYRILKDIIQKDLVVTNVSKYTVKVVIL